MFSQRTWVACGAWGLRLSGIAQQCWDVVCALRHCLIWRVIGCSCGLRAVGIEVRRDIAHQTTVLYMARMIFFEVCDTILLLIASRTTSLNFTQIACVLSLMYLSIPETMYRDFALLGRVSSV